VAKNLNQKVWYRALKVLFFLCFIFSFIRFSYIWGYEFSDNVDTTLTREGYEEIGEMMKLYYSDLESLDSYTIGKEMYEDEKYTYRSETISDFWKDSYLLWDSIEYEGIVYKSAFNEYESLFSKIKPTIAVILAIILSFFVNSLAFWIISVLFVYIVKGERILFQLKKVIRK